MASQTRSVEEALMDLGTHAIEMALEDGETRDFVTDTVDLPTQITAYATSERSARSLGLYADDFGAGSIVVRLANGDEWQISVLARKVK